jgi:hypothetical protein
LGRGVHETLTFISPRLPETVRIGRGFVLTRQGPTTQCDILLYKARSPVLFRDGELVILTPDAVLGIIEVKTTTDRTVLETALGKFSAMGRKMGRDKSCVFALFSYESQLNDGQSVVNILRDKCDHPAAIIDLMNLGCSTFIKWWESDPEGAGVSYKKWHSYALDRMSAGYFMANVVDAVSPDSVRRNNWLWFPEDSKELRKTGEAEFRPHR